MSSNSLFFMYDKNCYSAAEKFWNIIFSFLLIFSLLKPINLKNVLKQFFLSNSNMQDKMIMFLNECLKKDK